MEAGAGPSSPLHQGVGGGYRSAPVSDFLYDDCGKNALKLASRGGTIIAELLRLAEHIPLAFTRPRQTEYGNLIFDFAYFKEREVIDQVIADSPELSRLDEEFWHTHVDLLDRFFRLFRSIFLYITELNRFLEEIDQGLYVSQSIDGIIDGSLDGVQLLCELHHLYGVMLLLLEEKIGGKAREHLIVSYIRYRGAGEPHVVDVTRLCRSTGYEPPLVASLSSTSVAASPTHHNHHHAASRGDEGEQQQQQQQEQQQRAASTDRGYPAAYFARVPVRGDVVRKLVSRLRSEDVYRMSLHYPLPEHRGVAMSVQGALLYTLLFFQPKILAEEGPVMTEIVQKHFFDAWVVNYYLGFTADLTVAWRCFPAASAAIARTVAVENVVYYQKHIARTVHQSNAELAEVLRDGTLTESYVLDNVFSTLLPLLRNANAALRWILLHGTRGQRPGQEYSPSLTASYRAVRDGVSDDDIIALLLRTAQVEFDLKEMFTELFADKKRRWKSARAAAARKMRKLSQYFAGDDVLSREHGNPQLCQWFGEVASKVEDLQYYRGGGGGGRAGKGSSIAPEEDPAAVSRRRLQKLVKALENVQEFSQVNASLQVVQYVQEAHALLQRMIRYLNIERRVLDTIAVVGDLSYAWEQLSVHGFFVKEIQGKIKSNPALSVQMHSVFVKLASLIEVPCRRVGEACFVCVPGVGTGSSGWGRHKGSRRQRHRRPGGDDNTNERGTPSFPSCDPRLAAALEATSSYYSNSIVAFVRRVLHVVPTAIFEALRKVMQLLIVDEVFKECPSKIARQNMKTMSQLPVRERLSAYTADIARYANGILAMESMRVGVNEVNSHQLLEDGIRRELVDQVARELHAGLHFDKKHPMTPAQLEEELHRLGQRLSGIRASFEYIQDYINVHGLRIWLEEFARIVNFNVDMEANAFVSKKIFPWSSRYQSESIPIPYFDPLTTSSSGEERVPAAAPPQPQRSRATTAPLQQSPSAASAASATPDGKHAYGFLGHVVQHLLCLTDPMHATYLSSVGSWYSRTSLTEVVGLRTFSCIGAALGPAGLRALDRLLCFIIAKDLQIVLNTIRRSVSAPLAPQRTSDGSDGSDASAAGAAQHRDPSSAPRTGGGGAPAHSASTTSVADTLHDIAIHLCSPNHDATAARADSLAVYTRLGDTLSPSLGPATEVLVRVGRLQLMRKMLSHELRSCSKLGSGSLYSALRMANDALLVELSTPSLALAGVPPPRQQQNAVHRSHRQRPSTATPVELEEAEANLASMFAVSTELSLYLDAVGITDVLRQIFVVPAQQPPIPFLVLYLLGLLMRSATRVIYDDRFSSCTPARVQDLVDPASLLAGLALLLRQLHTSVADSLITCLGQAVRVKLCVFSEAPPQQQQQEQGQPGSGAVVPVEVATLAHMLQLLFLYLDRPTSELQDTFLPPTLLGDVSCVPPPLVRQGRS